MLILWRITQLAPNLRQPRGKRFVAKAADLPSLQGAHIGCRNPTGRNLIEQCASELSAVGDALTELRLDELVERLSAEAGSQSR